MSQSAMSANTIRRRIVFWVGCLFIGLTSLSWATTTPIGQWHLDETTGATAADSSGSARTITLSGTYTHTVAQVNEGLTFDGSTASGTTGTWATLTGKIARSISLWFKTSSTADSAWVSWGAAGSNTLSEVGIRAHNLQFYDGAASHCVYPASSFANGQWHHLTLTWNPTLFTMELYVDGVLKKSANVSNPNTSSSQLFIGASAAGGAFFSGSLDEIAVYDRTLSATEVATVSGLGTYPLKMVSVLSPAYGSDVTGNTTVSIVAPGFTSATVNCWQAGGTYGADSTVATTSLAGANGSGSFTFPAGSYPHGPLILRITGTNGTVSDTCYLQLYNTGGISWNEGMPAAPPAQASGLALLFSDDFTSMPTMSSNGIGKTYASSKPGGGNFGVIPFTDVSNVAKNPFSQRETYFRIRCDSNLGSTGFISSMHSDGSGFSVKQPCYMECRFLAPYAPGSWPAFWTLTWNGSVPISTTAPNDEEDIIEGYGGDGSGSPGNSSLTYQLTSHQWHQTGLPAGDGISTAINMSTTGGNAGWAYTPHVFGMLVGPSTTTYYLDNIQVGSKTTSPVSLTDNFWFMINLAAGGGWPVDLSRYGGKIDMYVDYVRAYGMPASAPIANVTGNSVPILDGDTTPATGDNTDFGNVASSGGTQSCTYTIQNTGSASMTVGPVSLSGTNAADFGVTSQPATTVAAGGSTTFTVQFAPSATGLRTAGLSFTTTDVGRTPYTFAIQGTGTTPLGLPSPWLHQDVGPVGVAGSATYASGTFTLNGSGTTIASVNDYCHFVYQPVSGDCTITARVATEQNTNGWAKAGIMLRNSLTANDMAFDMGTSPSNGLHLYYRTTAGTAASGVVGGTGTAPYWVRVKRVGSVFTAYKSPDGSTWTAVGSGTTISMGSSIDVGLEQCSEVNSTLGTSTFDNVSVTTP